MIASNNPGTLITNNKFYFSEIYSLVVQSNMTFCLPDSLFCKTLSVFIFSKDDHRFTHCHHD